MSTKNLYVAGAQQLCMYKGDPLTEAIKYTSLSHEGAKTTAVLHVHPQQLTESGQPAGATCLVSVEGLACVLLLAVAVPLLCLPP